MADGRLLIVSNRLPVTVSAGAEGLVVSDATGGLATGLRAYHDPSRDRWIGWPGEVSGLTPAQRAEAETMWRARGITAVVLQKEQVERYYHGFANRVLWPLFHYLIDRVPVDAAGWDAYRQVNETFADAVAREYRPGDTIWVHDYQLMLLPALLRERVPAARIGFFLHIPFPSSEVFRTLPWRREILTGLLGADLVGFHTFAYMRHFVAALLHVDGVESDIDSVRVGEREVSLGVFPMGVDAENFGNMAQDAAVAELAARTRAEAGDRRIILGIDRLDYTKGIPRRLHAIERLLTRHPELRDAIRYIQVAVPSRGGVDSYQRFRRQVEEAVGRINGMCGTLSSSPVHYIHQGVSQAQLTALYTAADVMLVTPLRDGMNLVAKEFVASRVDEDGVLILSEFAGAAAELDGAVVVNPYDVESVATSVLRALSMNADERRARMRRLRQRVFEHDVHRWARTFLERLAAARPDAETSLQPAPDVSAAALLLAARQTRRLRLLLDYDGTLVPLARAPELAAPDDELLTLLRDLTGTPGIEVEIVSGRPRETLEQWFGEFPLRIWAEHGFWYHAGPGEPWTAAANAPAEWLKRIDSILMQFVESTPGSHVETKSASLAWHYRRADREFGARQAHELRMLLGDALSNQPFEVLEGKKVIEVRLRGVSKALVAHRVVENKGDTLVAAIGDDRTDEDLFRALPADSVTIAVGDHPRGARFRLADYRAVRRLLRALLAPAVASLLGTVPTAGVL